MKITPNNFYEMMAQESYWKINIKIAKEIGIKPALFLSDLIDKYNYNRYRDCLTEDEYFPYTQKEIEKETFIKPTSQKRIVNKLETLKLISTKMKSTNNNYISHSLHFKINEQEVIKLLKNNKED